MSYKEELKAKIQAAEEKLNALTQEFESYDKSSEEKQFAIDLHNQLCYTNHIDQCPWYYEIENNKHQWEKRAHKKFLDTAHALLSLGLEKELILTIGLLIRQL